MIEDHDDEITASKVSRELTSFLADDSLIMAMSASLAAETTPGAAQAVADLLIA